MSRWLIVFCLGPENILTINAMTARTWPNLEAARTSQKNESEPGRSSGVPAIYSSTGQERDKRRQSGRISSAVPKFS